MALFNDPVYAPSALMQILDSSGSGGTPRGTTGPTAPGYGPIGSLGSTATKAGIGLGVKGLTAGILGGLPGVAATFSNPMSWVGASIPIASMIASLSGVEPAVDQMYGVPTEEDIQNAIWGSPGVFVGKDLQAQRDAALAQGRSMSPAASDLGLPGVNQNADIAASMSPSGSMGTPGETASNSADAGIGGSDPGGMGGSGMGSGGMEAKGGVRRALHGPKKSIYGEAEPEDAIFIPDSMREGGPMTKQKAQVAKAMQEALRDLYRRRP